MQQVLIISYFFPPCNLTAANRIGSWVKYLPESQIAPIVITRNWTGNEITEQDRLSKSGDTLRIVKNENSEIHYLPYIPTFRDKVFINSGKSKFFSYLSKILTLVQLIFQNLFVSAISYNNIYYHAKKVLQENSEIKSFIISGNPFEQFYFGYLLKKEFPNIKWIVDYRDDWTTNKLTERSSLQKLINKYNQYFEKKWIAKADNLTSVSVEYCNRLTTLHQKKCHLLMNGFNTEIYNIKPVLKDNNDVFQFAYSGTIYPNQDFTLILNAISKIAETNPKIKFKIIFIGSKNHLPSSFTAKLSSYNISNLEIELTNRLKWAKNISYLKSSDVLLLSSYGNLKGIPSSKLFDYIACQTPILLAPSDNDIMQEIIEETETGYAVCTEKEIIKIISNIISQEILFQPKLDEIEKYSSKKQTQNLMSLI